MQFVLMLPGLLALGAARLAAMPALATLAAFAEGARREPRGMSAALLALVGLPPDAPVAPLAMLGAQADPGDDYVLCANPVHLAADRDTVVVVRAIDDLAQDDEQALIRMLDRHFADDGLAFQALRPDAWFARSSKRYDLATTPIDAVVHRPMFAYLPQGPDARRWKAWENEIQMLLHEHPLNAAREARSEATVTGIWFWGGGRLRDLRPPPATFAAAAPGRSGDLARGIARFTQGQALTLRSDEDPAHALASLDALRDVPAFAILVAPATIDPSLLEAKWIAPALRRLARRDVEPLHVVADGDGSAVTWSARAPGLWRRLAVHAHRGRFQWPQP